MKATTKCLVLGLCIFAVASLCAQDSIPKTGTFFLQSYGNIPAPFPFDPYAGLEPVVVLDATNHIYLVQDTPQDFQDLQSFNRMNRSSMMSMDGIAPHGGGGGGGEIVFPHWMPPTNGAIWLEVTNVTDTRMSGWIHNSTWPTPYALFFQQNLSHPFWSPQQTFYGSGLTNFTPFDIPKLERSNLFFRATVNLAPNIVATSGGHYVAIRRDGTVWAWGSNGNGQLGDGTWTDSDTPAQAIGLSNIVAVSSHQDAGFTLALDTGGKVWAWGANGSGQLGRNDGLFQDEDTAAQVVGLSNVVAIAAGANHALALKSDGTVWAWGDNSIYELGDTNGSRDYPLPVLGVSNALAVAAGGYGWSFAICADGTTWGWGFNEDDDLGIGNENDQPYPVITSLTNGMAIAAGYDHSTTLLVNGRVAACGGNWWNQIDDSGTQYSNFTIIPGLSNIVATAAGLNHNLSLDNKGNLYIWGNNPLGISAAPYLIPGISNVTAIAAGNNNSIISTSDGKIYTFDDTFTPIDLYSNYSSDGSGMSDAWEIQYFGHLGINSTNDADGDGWNNLQEYQNGTNPTNFDVPSAVGNAQAIRNTNQTVTITWNAIIPTPAHYAVYRQDYNYDTWQYGSSQQIGEVDGDDTSFEDDGSIAGEDDNSIYQVEAVYAGGYSPLSDEAYVDSMTPDTLNANLPFNISLVRNGTGRWQLMFSGISPDVQTIRLLWYSDEWDYTTQDISTNDIVNGVYAIPDNEVVNVLGDALDAQGIGPNDLPGRDFMWEYWRMTRHISWMGGDT